MEPTIVDHAPPAHEERPVAPPSEPPIEFNEPILSIDPHHGIDTTYRKLFVGGLAWQVRDCHPPLLLTAATALP